MIYEARLVGDRLFEEDADKRGYILVEYDNKTTWARPLLPYGEFQVPTKEWITKYAKPEDKQSAIGVYLMNVNNEDYFVWVGFTIYKDQLPADAMENYSYRRVRFTENWIIYTDDKDKQNAYVIKHTDGTTFTIDRTENAEKISLKDKDGSEFIMDRTTGGKFISLKDGTTSTQLKFDNTGKINLGASAGSLYSIVNDYMTQVQAITVGTAFGPSSTPLNLAAMTPLQTLWGQVFN